MTVEPVERAEITEQELTTCPVCAYSLMGLPDRHACPECGFSYDKRMLVETVNLKKQLSLAIAFSLFALPMLGLWGWMTYISGVARGFGFLVFLCFPIGGWYGYFWRRRHNNKIIVWDAGIQVIRKGKPGPVHSWDGIESVERSSVNGCAIVYLRDGSTARLFGERFFGSHRKTGEFVSRLRRCQDERCTLERNQPGKEPEKGSPGLPDGPND